MPKRYFCIYTFSRPAASLQSQEGVRNGGQGQEWDTVQEGKDVRRWPYTRFGGTWGWGLY